MQFQGVSLAKLNGKLRVRRLVCVPPCLCAALLIAGCDEAPPPETVAVVNREAGPARAARFVKLEALSEWNGNAWTSVAELNLIDATGATLQRTGWRASADSATATDTASNAIDGDPHSIWHTAWESDKPPPHALVIDLGAPRRLSGFRYLARQDKVVNGTIAQYRFYLSDDGVEWGQPVATGDFTSMSSPKIEKTVIFAQQSPNRPPVLEPVEARETPMGRPVSVRLRATDPDGDAIRFEAARLPAGLEIDAATGRISGTPIAPGSQTVEIVVTDPKGAAARASFAWKVLPPSSDGVALRAGEVRFVKLEALSEVEGRPWAAIAEFNLVDATGNALPRDGWKASADSAGAVESAANAIDGNAASLWHTRWVGDPPPYPHAFIVDLGRSTAIRGFRMLPRQDAVSNGTIARFRFYTSRDGVAWGDSIAEGDFSSMPGGWKAEKTIVLDK